MSRSLLYTFKNINSYLNSISPTDPITAKITIGSGFLLSSSHMCYTYFTFDKKTIIVKKKYKFNRNGFTEFMIIDESGNHYNVNNSLWFWKWNSNEDYHKIETKQKINIYFYGYRFPILGIFPNIVSLKNIFL